jgi:hypothetical protein
MKFHGVMEEFEYSIDEDYPSIVISEITNNRTAFEYLKQHGLIRNDICHFCGEVPIDNKYTFTDPISDIKINICRSCHDAGNRTQQAMGIKPKNSTGCLLVVFLVALSAFIVTAVTKIV